MPSFLTEASTHRKASYVVPVILNICTDHESYTTGVLELIRQGFKNLNHEQVRPYFRTLIDLIELKDSLQEWRVNQTLAMLLNVMKEHEYYWKMYDMCTDHLIRFSKRSQLVYKWLHGHGQVLDWVANWLKTNPNPPPQMATERIDMKLEKERGEPIGLYQDKYECTTQTSKYAPYGLSNQAKQIHIELIKNGREGELDRKNTVYDSDELLEDRKFVKDEKVDALDTDINWINAQVIETHPVKGVYVKYEDWSDKWNEWISSSSPRVARANTLTQHNPPKKKKGT